MLFLFCPRLSNRRSPLTLLSFLNCRQALFYQWQLRRCTRFSLRPLVQPASQPQQPIAPQPFDSHFAFRCKDGWLRYVTPCRILAMIHLRSLSINESGWGYRRHVVLSWLFHHFQFLLQSILPLVSIPDGGRRSIRPMRVSAILSYNPGHIVSLFFVRIGIRPKHC